MATTRRTRRSKALLTAAAALGLALPVLTTAVPASAATVAVPGMTVTTSLDAASGRGTVQITMTTGRSLKITCNGGVNVNGVQVKIPCNNLVQLDITGSTGDDTVDIEGTGFQPLAVPGASAVLGAIRLGAGNDTLAMRMRKTGIDVWGGPGNDRLSNGVYPTEPNGFGYGGLYGEDGNDTLINAGFLSGPKPVYDPANPGLTNVYGVLLSGGPGADSIVGAPDRMDEADIDLSDTVALGAGPARVTVNLTQTTNVVAIDGNGNYGPKVAVTTAGKAWNLALPTLTQGLHVNTLGGPDQVTISRKSARTPISVDTGSGADVLTIRPWTPYQWDKAKNTITQPGAQPITWAQRSGTTVKVAPL